MKNHFCLVLHSHIPYVKKAGVWPFGEEWLLEGMLETYVPLIMMLRRLGSSFPDSSVTVGITPVLAEQLDDDYIKTRFVEYARDRIRRAREDTSRFARSRQTHAENIARAYADAFTERLEYFNKIDGDITGELASLEDAGTVELITSAATHAYLPLLSCDASVRAQIRTGLDSHLKRFGRRPAGFWLPECAYRPSYTLKNENGAAVVLKALDELLAAEKVGYFFVDTHAIEGGATSGYHGAAAGADGPLNGSSALRAYKTRAGVKVLARCREAGHLVWSSDTGYPGDGLYREFHKKDPVSGLQYWRITSKKTDLGAKEAYDPGAASRRARVHAGHFKKVVGEILEHASFGGSKAVVAPYDSELYGHWWHEGIEWLEAVLGELSSSGTGVSSASGYLADAGETFPVDLPEASWGDGGGHYVWLNGETEWMWRMIHECERKTAELLGVRARIRNGRAGIVAQLLREKLLLESSDWEFLVTTRQAREYGEKRFLSHYNRFMALAAMLEKNEITADDSRALAVMSAADGIFPGIKAGDFAPRRRQG